MYNGQDLVEVPITVTIGLPRENVQNATQHLQNLLELGMKQSKSDAKMETTESLTESLTEPVTEPVTESVTEPLTEPPTASNTRSGNTESSEIIKRLLLYVTLIVLTFIAFVMISPSHAFLLILAAIGK